MKNIGVLTGGGDAAGLNAAIKWLVTGLDIFRDGQYRCIGIKNGYQGLEIGNPASLTDNFDYFRDETDIHFVELTPARVRPWGSDGGTHLGSSRTNPCKDGKSRKEGLVRPSADRIKDVLERIGKLGIEALVTLGGEDTQGVAARLYRDYGVPVVGIPKTIDLDLPETDYTLGFRTALELNTSLIDILRTTAGSHSRIFVVEVMGRKAGHLTLQTGIVNGVEAIIIPEHPFDTDAIAELIQNYRAKRKHRYEIIAIAEGSEDKAGLYRLSSGEVDQFGHAQLGGVGAFLANALEKIIGKDSTRHILLGHLQRGGRPVAYDRLMGRQFGLAAASLVHSGTFGVMVNLRDNVVGYCPIEKALGPLHLVDIPNEYDAKRYNGKINVLTKFEGMKNN